MYTQNIFTYVVESELEFYRFNKVCHVVEADSTATRADLRGEDDSRNHTRGAEDTLGVCAVSTNNDQI